MNLIILAKRMSNYLAIRYSKDKLRVAEAHISNLEIFREFSPQSIEPYLDKCEHKLYIDLSELAEESPENTVNMVKRICWAVFTDDMREGKIKFSPSLNTLALYLESPVNVALKNIPADKRADIIKSLLPIVPDANRFLVRNYLLVEESLSFKANKTDSHTEHLSPLHLIMHGNPSEHKKSVLSFLGVIEENIDMGIDKRLMNADYPEFFQEMEDRGLLADPLFQRARSKYLKQYAAEIFNVAAKSPQAINVDAGERNVLAGHFAICEKTFKTNETDPVHFFSKGGLSVMQAFGKCGNVVYVLRSDVSNGQNFYITTTIRDTVPLYSLATPLLQKVL